MLEHQLNVGVRCSCSLPTHMSALAQDLAAETQRTEDVLLRWMDDLQRMGEVCVRVDQTCTPIGNVLETVSVSSSKFHQSYSALTSILAADAADNGLGAGALPKAGTSNGVDARLRGYPPRAGEVAKTESPPHVLNVGASAVASVTAVESEIHAQRKNVMDKVGELEVAMSSNQCRVGELEADLREEFRMQLQRNFMIWYKEEQQLKQQLSIAKELVRPLTQELEDLRRFSSESKVAR